MATVLCTGVQPALTQTRKMILESRGHIAVTAHSAAEIVAACHDFRFDVTVIGQCPNARLKRDWLALIRRHCFSVRVIEVYMTSAGRALQDADEWLESPVDPARLSERVSNLASRTRLAVMP